MKYDRSEIMRRARQRRRMQGLDMSAAMKVAWAEAKGAMPSAAVQDGQETGLRATLARYGLDRVADRAKAFVMALQTEIHALADRRRAKLLPPHAGPEIEARKDAGGRYSIS